MDSSNQFGIVPAGGFILITNHVPTVANGGGSLTYEEAMNMAAWLVAMTDPKNQRFGKLMSEIVTGNAFED